HDPRLHPLGVQTHIQAEHARMVVDLESFNLKVVLGLTIGTVAQVVSQTNIPTHLFQETLVQLRTLTGHAGFQLVASTNHACLHQIEFHLPSPSLSCSLTNKLIRPPT